MKKVMKKPLLLAPLAVAVSLASVQVYAESDSITDAVKNGKADLSMRLRYEKVGQDNALDDADALTLKTRLAYTTDTIKGFGAKLEMDDVTKVYGDYNDTANGKTDYSTVADPEGTEVNQAYVSYAGLNKSLFKYGRQRIALDNHRFIGTVGWRQNEQTYDAFSFGNTGLENATFDIGYITNVNRIFGEGSLVGDVKMETPILNASYKTPVGKVTAYYYDIDAQPRSAQPAGLETWDSQTMGLRFAGSVGEDVKFLYTAEYATQSDANDNTMSYDADYTLLEGGITVSGVTAKVGYEVLGADGADGVFITPLATLHKFQGWTDQFLGGGKGNIDGGIEDISMSVGGKWAGVKLLAVYHQFTSDDDSANGFTGDDLGSEYGFVVAKQFGAYGLALKYADYSVGDNTATNVDTDKLWLTATAKF